MKFILLVLRTTFHYFIYIAFFLILLILVFSLIAKQIYSRGCDFSGILQQEKSFGSFSSTLVTIFNLITLDNWNSLITAAYKANLQLPLIFISLFLIFFGNFIVLNLFIAIMLDSFEKVKKQLSEKVLSEVKDKEKTNKQLYLELKNPLLTKENPLDLIKQLDSEIFTEEEPFIRDETISPITVALQNPFKNAPFDIKGLEKVPCESSLYLFNKASIIRRTCYKVVHSAYFERVIYLLIISVSIVLALDTFLESSFWVVELCNIAINSGFLLESLMKIISEGLLMDKGSYLRDYKSVLDFLTIGLSFFGLFGPRYNSLKAVLLIRLWRPFSIIYKRKYIKDLINALISSLYQIINVFIVVFTVWFVFSLIGIQLFRNRFGFCENRVNYHVSFEECQNTKKKWSIFFLNYDDIGSALISIFVLSTMDNWANQLNIGVNSDLPERGPSRNNNQFSSYCFFLAFVIIAVWLFYNLFIGVIFSNFIETSQRNLHPFLTPSQVKWLEIQDFILKLDEKVFYLPKKGFRLFLYRILERKVFEWVLKVILAVNFLILAIYSEELKKKSWYRGALYSLCTFFLLEAFIKIFVYRRHYFISKWGVFNLLAALAYLIDILFLVFEKEIEALGFGWKFIRLAHVLIVVSLIRIIEKLTGLRDILMTIFLSWRLLMNMILLMFIVLFIYAVIGVYMFKEVIQGEVINENNNFSNLFYALMTLFKCLTREEWSNLLFDLSKTPPNCEDKKDCGSRFTPLYLISFMIFNTYIIFNLFILILLQQFEEFHKNIFNPMVVFKQYLGPFKIVWDRISIKGKRGGDRELHITKLLKLFKELGPPLGSFLIKGGLFI